MKNYPENLTAEYEMLECLAFHDDSETILSSRRSDEKLFVIKVFFFESPLYDFVVPDEIKDLDHPAIPKFIDEYRSDDLRYEIREYVPGTPLDKLLQNKEHYHQLSAGQHPQFRNRHLIIFSLQLLSMQKKKIHKQ